MNTQRKVVITTTYNEMGIIIDTKAEEVAQPDTTTHDSIPAETGKNDGDKTSGDCISRQQAIDAIEKHLKWTTIPDYYPGIFEAVRGWLNGLPSVQPEIIRCKDCKHSKFFDPCFYCYEMGGEIIVPENGFCFKAERREDG